MYTAKINNETKRFTTAQAAKAWAKKTAKNHEGNFMMKIYEGEKLAFIKSNTSEGSFWMRSY